MTSPPGRDVEFARPRAVRRIRIGNVKRAMILAAWVAAVDGVNTLWSAEIAFALLWPHRITFQRNLVRLDHLSSVHKLHRVILFVHDDAIRVRKGGERRS